ncbi:MAG TPA: hypothetical protein VMH86_02015 [Rhizomicrobium sp.]|nr:hypothetical protein [Rhizomicrobium sp.]
MTLRYAAHILALMGSLVALGACSYSPGIVDRTVSFNRGVAESTNQLIVLNALRASKRNPTYYSRLTGDTTTSTAAPSLSSAIPWEPTKAITSTFLPPSPIPTGISRVLTKNPLSLTPGLTLTEGTQLALSNSDDQASTTGLMTPVSLQLYAYFRSEGFNAEELGLLFFGSVALTDDQRQALATAMTRKCGAQCAADLDACPVPDARLFANDPALFEATRDRKAEDGRTYTNFRCFHAILNALLKLGLKPQSKSSHAFLYSVPESGALRNPRYLADLSQQGLEIAPDGQNVAVCKKSDDIALQLDALDASIDPDGSLSRRLGLNDSKPHPDAGPPSAGAAPSFAGTAFVTAASKPLDNPCLQAMKDAAAKKKGGGKNSASEAAEVKAIGFSQRSLEAMVYYLGEIIRRDADQTNATGVSGGDSASAVTFTNTANASSSYQEALFSVRRGDPSPGAIVSVSYDDQNYYVPALCAEDNCSEELPDHASAQVLTMLNQIWNLQKTTVAAPIVPTVTVVTPP